MQNRVVGFSFDMMIINIINPKTSKRSFPHANVVSSNNGTRPDGDHKKAAVSVKNSSQRSTLKLKPGEKHSDFTSHHAKLPIHAREKEA
jgi:hypothetical protein